MFSLFICTVFYVGVAIVLTGIQPWQSLRNAAPVANALEAIGLPRVEQWVTVGALMGMISSLLVFQLGQARVWFSMSRDGLLPHAFSRVHPKFRTPDVATWIAGVFVGIPAGIFDIGTLADLSNIGTLFAFMLVSLAVLILRRTPARPAARLSRAFCPRAANPFHALLPGPDGRPDARKLDSLLRLAHHWSGDLLRVQPQAQRPRYRGTCRGASVSRSVCESIRCSQPRERFVSIGNFAGRNVRPAAQTRVTGKSVPPADLL